MQDNYVDTQLSWPDVNCASRLCFKGTCKYKIKDGAGLTGDWLCRHVTPHISVAFGKTVGRILALPLIWACFSDTFAERVQPEIRSRIVGQFIRLEREGFEDGINPIEKVEVIPNEGTRTLEEAPVHPSSHSPVHLHLWFSLWHHCHGRDECSTRRRHSR